MDTWQAKWKPPRPVHNNPCLVLGSSEEEALKEAFSQYGSVSETFSPKGQNFTFVHFEDKYDAEKAMNALNNTKIGGKQVKVSPQFRDELFLSLLFIILVTLHSLQVTDGKCANREVNEWRASLLRGK